MSAWESTRTPSLRKSASCSIIALRNNSESPILSSSATVHSPSVDWSLLKEPHGGRPRQQPLPFTHSRGHYRHHLGQLPRLAAVDRGPRRGGRDAGRVARVYQHPPGSQLQLRGHQRAAEGARAESREPLVGVGAPGSERIYRYTDS